MQLPIGQGHDLLLDGPGVILLFGLGQRQPVQLLPEQLLLLPALPGILLEIKLEAPP